MEKFEIKANVCLKQDVQGYYHSIYQSMYTMTIIILF